MSSNDIEMMDNALENAIMIASHGDIYFVFIYFFFFVYGKGPVPSGIISPADYSYAECAEPFGNISR